MRAVGRTPGGPRYDLHAIRQPGDPWRPGSEDAVLPWPGAPTQCEWAPGGPDDRCLETGSHILYAGGHERVLCRGHAISMLNFALVNLSGSRESLQRQINEVQSDVDVLERLLAGVEDEVHECEMCEERATHRLTIFSPGGSESEWYCPAHAPAMSTELDE